VKFCVSEETICFIGKSERGKREKEGRDGGREGGRENERGLSSTGAIATRTSLLRSTYVVTNDKFIFPQSLCICKTAEVHQDVKCFL